MTVTPPFINISIGKLFLLIILTLLFLYEYSNIS